MGSLLDTAKATQPARHTGGLAYTIAFQGGSRGQPGVGSGTYDLVNHATGRTMHGSIRPGGWLGTQTPTEAAYLTLIGALEHLICLLLEQEVDSRTVTLTIESDAHLVMHQLSGRWPVAHALLIPLHADAQGLVARFKQVAYVGQTRAELVHRCGSADAGCRQPHAPAMHREAPPNTDPPGRPSGRAGTPSGVPIAPPHTAPAAVPRVRRWEAR